MQDIHCRKATEQAQQRSDMLEENLKILQETVQQTQHAEAEIKAQQDEKQLKEELEYTRSMLAELSIEQDMTNRMYTQIKNFFCN